MTPAPVIILHFSPVEFYPPVMNLLNYASEKGPSREWIVVTTCVKGTDMASFAAKGIRILRRGKAGRNQTRMNRVLSYIRFYASSCFLILSKRPGAVLYFETLSCLPAYVCRFIFRRESILMLHHHEYVTPAEYEHGSFFFRFLHRLEKRILPLASWISHTNRDRLQFFSKDMGLSDNFPCRILPNYPPAKWTVKSLKEELELPLKIVYLGALSEDTMYLKEFADWVIKQGGKVCWDIYSMQPDPAVLNYLLSLSSPYIRLKGSLDYESIPSVLRNYDVGVILYKGHIPNYVYNAPNKMFEYHVSGLDVWLPGVMVGARPYLTSVTYPKILSLDFEHLDRLDLSLLTARKGLAPKIGDYSCEKVLSSIYDELENA